MSSQTLPRPKRRVSNARKKKKTGFSWLTWWPLLAGIAITFATVNTAEILPLMGPAGLFKLRLLYPFALLLQQPQLGLSEPTSNSWSQIMLYAQFPLYGLYASLATRWKPVGRVVLHLIAIHMVAFATLWVLARK